MRRKCSDTFRLAYYYARFVCALLLLPSFSSADAQTIPFSQNIIDLAHPRNPHCKTIGDIDGDGYLDVLVASSTNYTEGLFWYKYPSWTKYRISTGSFTTDMQTADVDGDGDLDVVIPKGAESGASVYWYENPLPAGDPRYTPWREHFIGNAGAHDVEVADINKDGRMDVLVRLFHTNIFFQNADFSWTKVTVSTAGAEGIAVGDIDGDNDLDIALNGFWLENPLPSGNPMTASWTSRTFSSSWPSQVAAALTDINKDGRLDILLSASESQNGKIAWYESANPRSGPWTEHLVKDGVSYVHEFHVFDMDNDGDLDIAYAEMHQSPTKRVAIMLNAGGALTWTEQVLTLSGSHNIRVGDFGNDGDYDIIGSNWNNGNSNGATVFFWENRLNNSPLSLNNWTRREIDSSRPWQSIFVTSADIDRDGLKDIVSGAWWYKNPGTSGGTWTRSTIGSPLNNMAAVFDFDNDGDPDILGTRGVGSNANAQFVWARNDSAGQFSILTNIANGDGDFLQGVEVRRYVNVANEPYRVALSWHQAGKGIQTLTVPEDPGTGTWTWARISSSSQDEQLSATDIDRDGYIDLVMGTKWLRNSSSGWTLQTLSNTPGSPDRNRAGDLNNDGRVDVVVGYEAISVLGRLAWYEQPVAATAIWTEHVISDSVVGPMSLDLVDMDRDGDLDVIVGEHNTANPSTARLIIFENVDGMGTSWAKHVVHTGDEHHDGAHVVDIDNDGDLDIVSIGWENYKVILYENTSLSASTGPPLISSHPQNISRNPGESAVFAVTASGAPPLAYQWLRNGSPVGGALATTYTLPSVSASDNGAQFRCIVSNSLGTVSSNAALLTVTSSSRGPTITLQPANQTVTVGQTATFQVQASGTSPVSYQWQKGGVNISGANASSYTTPAAVLSENGSSYRCIVSNGDGTTSSSVATLTVVPQPVSRVTANLVALYKFDEGTGNIVNDVSGVGSPLNLTIANTAHTSWGQGYLSVNASTILSTASAAQKVISACKASNEITAEMWIKTAYLNQSGPARIVTISADLMNRDFTVGQGASGGSTSAFEVRRRTSSTSSNGTPAITTPSILTTDLIHVAVTRSASGETRVYVDGSQISNASVGGTFANWADYKLALANELTNDRPWIGEYHLVALYSRALTPSEVAQNYSLGPDGSHTLYVNTRLYLQGAFNPAGDTMRADIRAYAPLTQPYSAVPWNYAGTESVGSVPPNVVDWVLVELRSGTTANTTVSRRAGFLKTNGVVVDLDGFSPLKFQGSAAGNYYVVVVHRNHLAVMSSTSVALSQTSSLIDFAGSADNTYGISPQVALKADVFGLYAGDGNGSGIITASDANGIFGIFNQNGYHTYDVNLSGIVTAADANIVFGNLNKATQVP